MPNQFSWQNGRILTRIFPRVMAYVHLHFAAVELCRARARERHSDMSQRGEDIRPPLK